MRVLSLSLFRSFPKFQLPVLASITALGPFAVDAYLPAFPAIAASLDVDPVLMTQTMSAYFIGLSIGALLGGPISDQIGRRPVAFFGLTVIGITSLLLPLVSSLEQMLLMRIVQAVGGGAASAVVVPTIRDVSPVSLFASRAGLVFTLLMIAPMIAPVAGAFLLDFGWEWIFIAIGCYTLLVLAVYAAGISESNESRTGRFKAKPVFYSFLRVASHKLGNGLHPIRYGIAYSFSFGALFTYLTNSSYIFQTYYGVSPDLFTVFFAINVGFVGAVQLASSRFLRGRSLQAMARFMRFGFGAQFVALAATLMMLLFAEPPLWLFFIFLTISLGLFGVIVPSAIGVYMSPFKQSSGTASAITTTLGFLLGAALGSLSGLLNQGDLLVCFGIMLSASFAANLILLSISGKRERAALDSLQDGHEAPI